MLDKQGRLGNTLQAETTTQLSSQQSFPFQTTLITANVNEISGTILLPVRALKFDGDEKLSNYSVKIIKVVEHDGQMSKNRRQPVMINGTPAPSSVESLRRVVDVDE